MPLPPEAYHRLFLIGRGLSLLMAAGTLLLVYRCGREAGDRRAATAVDEQQRAHGPLRLLREARKPGGAVPLLVGAVAAVPAEGPGPAPTSRLPAARGDRGAGGDHEGPGLRPLCPDGAAGRGGPPPSRPQGARDGPSRERAPERRHAAGGRGGGRALPGHP